MSKLKKWIRQILWTQSRIDMWIEYHLPSTGYIGIKWLIRRADLWGINWEELRSGLDRVGVKIWDGDGHHLTVVARKSSDDIRYPERDPKYVDSNISDQIKSALKPQP